MMIELEYSMGQQMMTHKDIINWLSSRLGVAVAVVSFLSTVGAASFFLYNTLAFASDVEEVKIAQQKLEQNVIQTFEDYKLKRLIGELNDIDAKAAIMPLNKYELYRQQKLKRELEVYTDKDSVN